VIRRSSVGHQVLAAVFAASAAVVALATFVQLSQEYDSDIAQVETSLDRIGAERIESLAEGLWTVDHEQLQAQLRGLLAMPDVELVRVDQTDGPPIELGAERSERSIERSWPLSHVYRGEVIPLGSLRVRAGLDRAARGIWERLGTIAATQGVGVVLLAALSLLLIDGLVLRHVRALALQARSGAAGDLGQPFALARRAADPGNELDELARALERLRRQLAERIEALGERGDELVRDLETRTAERDAAVLERRLQETQRLESLGLLAGGVAHDFNNLLVGILGNASLVFDELADRPDARARVGQLVQASRRASELTRQLLAYSGKGRFVVETIDISSLIRELSDLLRTSLPGRASLQLDLPPEGPFVHADATQLRQVVLNLITNASDALGPDGGTIRVSTRSAAHDDESLRRSYANADLTPGRYVHIDVADTGEGMDRETQAQMFEPFFTTKETGHGLGLAATLGIVRGHGGAVKVYSEPGEGTTVQVLLPESEDRPGSTTPEARSNILDHDGARRRILVVDDEPVVRSLARAVLERSGHEVLEAVDGLDALRQFREGPDDVALVLLDMTMPRMSGVECLRELRAIRADIPVLLSSGYNEQDAVARVAGRGLAGFLQKPYTAAQLVDKVDEVLS
jgi:signal transduction histidine kinase/CheY-like chemotaxis protein